MNTFRGLGWPHLVPSGRLHKARLSLPTNGSGRKSTSVREIQSHESFITAPELNSPTLEEPSQVPLQILSAGPEPASPSSSGTAFPKLYICTRGNSDSAENQNIAMDTTLNCSPPSPKNWLQSLTSPHETPPILPDGPVNPPNHCTVGGELICREAPETVRVEVSEHSDMPGTIHSTMEVMSPVRVESAPVSLMATETSPDPQDPTPEAPPAPSLRLATPISQTLTHSPAITRTENAQLPSISPALSQSANAPIDSLGDLAEVTPDIPYAREILALQMPQAASIPGVPTDVTGLAAIPDTPAPKLGKKARGKAIAHKVIRTSRRIVMRKRILAIPLGRQLSGPVADALKLISQGIPIPTIVDALGSASIPAPVPV